MNFLAEVSPNKDEIHGSRTLPRPLPSSSRLKYKQTADFEDTEGLYLPPGIEELESLYAPMKNLSRPLPSATASISTQNYSDQTVMPLPHPLR